MQQLRIKLNLFLISFSYLLSYTFSIAFLYYLLFYNSDKTNSDPLSWTIIRASFLLPGALSNIFVGVLVDKYNKKKFMYLSELLSGILVLSFMLLFNLGFDKTLHLALYGIALNIVFSFYEIALDASMVNISNEKLGEKLISLIWFMRALSFVLGPIIAEKIYEAYSPTSIFLINGLTFLISSISVILTKFSNMQIKENTKIKNFKNDLLELKTYISKNPIIKFLVTLNVSIALFYMPIYDALIPNMAYALNLSKSGIAYIESASWVGTALTSILILFIGKIKFFLKNLFNSLRLQMIFLSLWLFPLMFKNLSIKNMVIVYVFLAVLDGAINATQTLGALNYFQIKVPEEIRGKMLGLVKTVMRISSPIGTVFYGIALKYYSWNIVLGFSVLVIFLIGTYLGNKKTFKTFSKEL